MLSHIYIEMDKLSKDELLKILASSEKPRKQRKRPDLDDDKKIAMLERLAAMRETVKKNRETKKASAIEEVHIKEKEIDEVFEKKYGSKFDRMNELLTDLNENTKEQLKIKREKLAKKTEIKPAEEKPAEVRLEVKEPLATPKVMTTLPPKPVHVAPTPFPNPSRPTFLKGNTRF